MATVSSSKMLRHDAPRFANNTYLIPHTPTVAAAAAAIMGCARPRRATWSTPCRFITRQGCLCIYFPRRTSTAVVSSPCRWLGCLRLYFHRRNLTTAASFLPYLLPTTSGCCCDRGVRTATPRDLKHPLPLHTARASTAILPPQDRSCCCTSPFLCTRQGCPRLYSPPQDVSYCSPVLKRHRLHGIFGCPSSSRTRPAPVVTIGKFRR